MSRIPVFIQQNALQFANLLSKLSQGLLFYATNLWNSRGDYLAVQIKDGSVVVSLDLGSTPDQDGSTTGEKMNMVTCLPSLYRLTRDGFRCVLASL